jgi:selenocysteine-specific elongation factor
MQTQTAECLVIGELTTDKLVVALNKADLLPAETREATLARLRKRLATTLAATRFAGCSQVVVSARPGGDGAAGGAEGMEELVTAMLALAPVPQPESTPLPPFLLAVDHCFTVRGQGAVLTGTVLRGRVAVGQAVELPALRMVKKARGARLWRSRGAPYSPPAHGTTGEEPASLPRARDLRRPRRPRGPLPGPVRLEAVRARPCCGAG